jgi:pyruvate dehydrogenase E2 component (dihydrolipoamide acetyltransferase)
MAIEIKVPRLGWSMEEGTFVEWLKRNGQDVRAGEPLFAIEGDKAIQEVEAIGSGILCISPHGPANGETVKVGVTLAFLAEPGEANPFEGPKKVDGTRTSASSVEPSVPATSEPASPLASREAATAARVTQTRDRPGSTKLRISPRAARLAAQLQVDAKSIRGSGRNGRVCERDVRAQAERHGSKAPSSIRRTIADRMSAGAHAAAPVTLTTTADATNLVSLRARFKSAAKNSGEPIPGYTDIVTKLAARALGEHPALNQQWIDGEIVDPGGVHIAIAIDTPAGLLAPVIRDVSTLALREIAARMSDLKTRAAASRLRPEELGGGTFTITNLGAFGVDAFTPIINVPQCAVLGLGRIDRRAVVVGDQIVPRDVITLSLTFDHRIVDGAPAARFLATLRKAIENPGPWLVF